MIEIPLTSDGEQKFSMLLDGMLYNFRVIYNTRANPPNGLWSLSIASGGVELVNGAAMLIGGDILSPVNIGLKNLFMINTTESSEDATADNLGTAVRLYHLTDAEVSSVSSV